MKHQLKIIASNFKWDFVMLQNFVLENPGIYNISESNIFDGKRILNLLIHDFKLYLRNAPIREYKLIQTYPGSPKKGLLVERVVKKSDYYVEKTVDGDYSYKFYKGHIERQTKFWRRIK